MRKIIILALLIASMGLFAQANATSYSTSSLIGKEDLHCFDGVNSTFTRRTSTGGALTLTPINNVVDVACVYSSLGKTDTAISAAQSVVGTTPAVLELSPGTWTISDNLTIASTITLRPVRGAILSVAVNKTLTINGAPSLGHYTVFAGSGTVVFGSSALLSPPDPAWWGGGTGGVTAANAALNIIGTFTANSATPNVSGLLPVYKTANSSPTTITAFSNIVKGQTFKVIINDANTTVTFGANIKGNGSASWSPGSGDSMDCSTDGTYSYCVNSNVYVPPTAYSTVLVSSFSNLIVKNDASTPNTKLNVTANSIMVTTGTLYRVLTAVSLMAIDCTAVGQAAGNDLDAGSLQASTWYYVYVIYNFGGSTVAGLVSASATSPTLPTGYAYKRLAGVAITDASAHFIPFEQTNMEWSYNVPRATATITSTSYASVDISTNMPPNTIAPVGIFALGMISFSSGSNPTMFISNDGSTTWALAFNMSIAVFSPHQQVRMPVLTSQTVYCCRGAGTLSTGLWMYGFVLNL